MSNDEFLRIARAVADPTRFDILSRIARTPGECACAELTGSLDVTPATISHHLKELAAAGLIDARREGKFMHHRIRHDRWNAYLAELQRRIPPR
ncbi:MAG: metalloregulator ArsR/SmtB family transcription factor [Bryobacteraceae bacterium]|nr:metalloregulator ArsR/SmtB family transcription factor [Bryobacteraceae bacterium]